MLEWGDASTQELKSVPYYGTSRPTPLFASTPNEVDLNIGLDWDYGVPEETMEILLCHWCEQHTAEHVFWFPLLLYRSLTEPLHPLVFDTDSFSKTFLAHLSMLSNASQESYGIGFCRFLSRGSGEASKRWRSVPGAQDICTCFDAIRIVLM
jgi:hypothetical protein